MQTRCGSAVILRKGQPCPLLEPAIWRNYRRGELQCPLSHLPVIDLYNSFHMPRTGPSRFNGVPAIPNYWQLRTLMERSASILCRTRMNLPTRKLLHLPQRRMARTSSMCQGFQGQRNRPYHLSSPLNGFVVLFLHLSVTVAGLFL